jgi:hypothetical protein
MRVQSCSAYFEVSIRRANAQAYSKYAGYGYAEGESARNRPSRRAFTTIGSFPEFDAMAKKCKTFYSRINN